MMTSMAAKTMKIVLVMILIMMGMITMLLHSADDISYDDNNYVDGIDHDDDNAGDHNFKNKDDNIDEWMVTVLQFCNGNNDHKESHIANDDAVDALS